MSKTEKHYLMDITTLAANAKQLVTNPAFIAVMGSLERDRDDALEELKCVSPHEPEKIAKLQNVIFRHDEMTNRISILILDGQRAEEEISDDLNEEA